MQDATTHPDPIKSDTRQAPNRATRLIRTLFVITLVLNIISISFVRRYRQVY